MLSSKCSHKVTGQKCEQNIQVAVRWNNEIYFNKIALGLSTNDIYKIGSINSILCYNRSSLEQLTSIFFSGDCNREPVCTIQGQVRYNIQASESDGLFLRVSGGHTREDG